VNLLIGKFGLEYNWLPSVTLVVILILDKPVCENLERLSIMRTY